MKGIYLLLGSNLGNSEQMLKNASELIKRDVGDIIIASSIYYSKAWGIEDQPDFLNQVLEVDTELNPEDLLMVVNGIESQLGRVRKVKWGSRLIDIDILYYGDMVLDSEHLSIPHPENQNRNFVMIPMVEVAPDFRHPIQKLTQKEMLERCPDQLSVKMAKKKPAQ